MAVWQLIKGKEPVAALALFDDGAQAAPGDPDFSTAAVVAAVTASAGAADGFNYVGMSQPAAE